LPKAFLHIASKVHTNEADTSAALAQGTREASLNCKLPHLLLPDASKGEHDICTRHPLAVSLKYCSRESQRQQKLFLSMHKMAVGCLRHPTLAASLSFNGVAYKSYSAQLLPSDICQEVGAANSGQVEQFKESILR